MPPFRHLLFIQRNHATGGRGRRWAQRVADALDASLSVRADGPRPWDPRSALEGPWDLLLKVAEPRRGPLPWRIHPRDRSLLATCPIPVWLLHPAQGGAVSSVLAAVGVSGPADAPEYRRVMRTGALLAQRLGGSLTVVRPWSLLGETILASPLRGVSRERYRGILEETHREHEALLERTLAAEIPETPVTMVVRKGLPETVIRDAGWRCDAEVLVMDPVDARGWGDRILGPLPERLFRGIPCSLLLARTPRERPARQGIPAGQVASLPHTGAV
ncbi:MAG TPA: universal stress protein [Longimicrobiales bacterium]|nr:universal stress protein [Longimicrobiales bacterium]